VPERIARRRIDGVLLLDKPFGITSNAALGRVKRAFRAQKGGHTGTLDPLATGLLPICRGAATRFAGALLDARKRYVATVRLGIATTTQDAEGEVVASRDATFAASELRAAIARRVGPQRQTPPAHSALKRDGRPYYAYARAGIEIERTPRPIEIHSLELLDWSPPDATVDIECSKGTYVRSFAADLGEELGCGAHLSSLRRTATGSFDVADAVTLDAIERMDDAARLVCLRPVDTLLAGIPRLELTATAAFDLACGRPSTIDASPGRYRVYGPAGHFLGLAEVDGERLLAVRLLPAEDHASWSNSARVVPA
jgi:tRNA pseudouridine55 synthase